MTDAAPTMDMPLPDVGKAEWLEAVKHISEEEGSFTQLSRQHSASFIERNGTLLVSFESIQGIQALSEMAQPLGWEMVRHQIWSHLCIISDGDTWFRDPAVYDHFDKLADEGFFDRFDNVVFYGAGPCAYAAAAFSVAAPFSTVIAIQPQATLDPRITEWDDRFADMRHLDFTSRYGYAPDMLDAAERVFVIYDPRESLDAMHAALFTRSNVTKLRMRFMGNTLQTDLIEMGQLHTLFNAAARGRMDTKLFARLYRNRREYRPYLRNLLSVLEAGKRDHLALTLCRYTTKRMRSERFERKLAELTDRLGSGNDTAAQ